MSYFSGQAMRILGFKPASLIIKGQDFAIPFSNDSGERRGRDETYHGDGGRVAWMVPIAFRRVGMALRRSG